MCLTHNCNISDRFGESQQPVLVLEEDDAATAAGGGPPGGGTRKPETRPPFFIQNRVKDCDKPSKEKPPEPDQLDCPYKIVRCSCRCRFCPDCAVGLGLSIREKLIPTVSTWVGMVMLSLTINPKQFESSEAAYRYVTSNRCISRLVRELNRVGALKSQKFFSVFECQKNGNPHWHVLLEANFIDHQIIKEIWNRFGPAEESTSENPSMGHAWISKSRFQDPRHAAQYATKYLIKAPSDGWPDWVLDYHGQIHRCSRSHGLFKHLENPKEVTYKHCPMCFCETCREGTKANAACECDECKEARALIEQIEMTDVPEPTTRKTRTVRERMKECGSQTVVLKRMFQEVRKGQAKCQFLCVLNEPFDQVCGKLGVSQKASQLFLRQADLDRLFEYDRESKREAGNYEWIP